MTADAQTARSSRSKCPSNLHTHPCLSPKLTCGRSTSSIPIVTTQTTMVRRALPEFSAPSNTKSVLYVDVARGRQLTYRQLRTSAERFGSGLQERWAWRKGDVLATMTPNTFECVPVTFGTIIIGVVICPFKSPGNQYSPTERQIQSKRGPRIPGVLVRNDRPTERRHVDTLQHGRERRPVRPDQRVNRLEDGQNSGLLTNVPHLRYTHTFSC